LIGLIVVVACRDKTFPRIQKHFPESKTLPRFQKHFPESKTCPRIHKHFPESKNTSQNPKTLPRIQNTCQKPKEYPNIQNTSVIDCFVFHRDRMMLSSYWENIWRILLGVATTKCSLLWSWLLFFKITLSSSKYSYL